MKDQADPVAPSADEAGGTAPRLDKTVRKSGTATADSDAEQAGTKSPGSESPDGQSPDGASPDGKSGTEQDAAAAVATGAKAGAGTEARSGAPAGSPSFAKAQDGKRSDMTVPRASVTQVKDAKPDGAETEASKPSGNGRADVPAKPLGAGAADTVVAPVPSTPQAAADRPGKPQDPPSDPSAEQESTSTLAAAALARELTGAGFASPGFTSTNLSGSDATTQARLPSPPPPGGAARPVAAETNPWVSPAAAGSAGPAPSAGNPGLGGAGSAATQAASPAPAAPPRPAYSPSGSPQTESVIGGHTAAVPAHDVLAPPQPARAPGSPVPSKSTKPKVASPFARPRKKKVKPSAGRPGGAIGNGKPTVSVKGKSGTLRRPAAPAAPKSARPDNVEARDAQLVVSRIEPWSVMKFSFMVSLLGWIVLIVAVALLYFAFSSLGVFHSIEKTVGLVTSSNGNPGSNAASWFSAGTVLGYTMLAGAIDVLLITALATVGAVIYNTVTRLSGGIEITLQEAD